MKLSLITVCYNAEKTIGDTVRSVFAQRCPVPIEYLVIDGASADATVAAVRDAVAASAGATARKTEDAQPAFAFQLVSEPDRGMYDALNKGIARATGDIVGILNADDRFSDECALADVAQAFADDPTLECVYADIRFVRGDSDETTRYYSSRRWRPWMHNWGFMPAHPTVYVRKTVFERFGAYKLGYDISADFEWMTRVLCRGQIKARYLPRCLVTMRLGGKSTAGLKAMLKLNRENCRANRENGYFSILPMMLPKYFFKIWGYVFRRRA